MLRIDRRISVMLSYGFCCAALVGILAIAAFLLFGNSAVLGMIRASVLAAQKSHAVFAFGLEFLILGLVLLSDLCLFRLLRNVSAGKIFTDGSVQYLRIISWASVLAGTAAIPLALLLGLVSLLAVSFIGFFLGIVLRVVKNVIEEGTIIKEENDGTI